MVLFFCFSWSFGIQLTWISEEGLPLFKKEEVQILPLLPLGGSHRLQQQEGFLHPGI